MHETLADSFGAVECLCLFINTDSAAGTANIASSRNNIRNRRADSDTASHRYASRADAVTAHGDGGTNANAPHYN